MGIIIDIIIVAIIVVSAVLAAKRGLIGTLFNLIGAVVAVTLAVVLCAPVSGFIDTNYVNPAVKSYIVGTVDATAIGKSNNDTEENKQFLAEKIEQMPDSLRSALELADIDPDKVVADIRAGIDVDNVIESIAAPISGTISRVIAFVALFVILCVALWVVTKLLTAVFGVLPLGKSINKVGGILFGVLRGLVIVFIISSFFTAMSKSVDPNGNNIFSKKTIDSTYVLKTAVDLDPIASILNIK